MGSACYQSGFLFASLRNWVWNGLSRKTYSCLTEFPEVVMNQAHMPHTWSNAPDILQHGSWDGCVTATASLYYHSIGPWMVALEVVLMLCLETTIMAATATTCHQTGFWAVPAASCHQPPFEWQIRDQFKVEVTWPCPRCKGVWESEYLTFSDLMGGGPHPGLDLFLLFASPCLWDPSLPLTYDLWLWPYCSSNSKHSITVDDVPDTVPSILYALNLLNLYPFYRG